MTSDFQDKTKRILLVAIILGLVSLALPWWNLVVLQGSQLLAYFGSHVWGVMKTGFIKSDFSYEWWSYATFALVGAGFACGLFGYKLMKRTRKAAKRLVLLEAVATLAGCVLYATGLSHAFPKFSQISDLWMLGTADQRYVIGIYSLFHFADVPSWKMLFVEFLSAGFFLALISLIFSFYAFIRLTKATPPINNSAESSTESSPEAHPM